MIHFDCHAHVYEKIRAVTGARYIPKAPAPLKTWLENLKKHNLKGGVIVQVSFLGTDNSELCNALSGLDKSRFAGVGVVAPDVDEGELDRLVAAGVRGIRWNLVHGAIIPDLDTPVLQKFTDKLRARNLHLEVHLEGPRLAHHLDQLADQGLNIVIDHFGLPSDPNPKDDPFFRTLGSLQKRENIYLKLSARYRTQFDLSPHLEAVKDMLPFNQTIWGSDWPHTQHEQSVSYEKSHHDTKEIEGICDMDAVKKLYGISII